MDIGTKAHATLVHALGDNLVQGFKGATANEQDVSRVHLHKRLFRMLTATLRRDRCNRTFQELQEALLHTFTAHVTRDGRVSGLTSNLVDFVDKDNAAFSFGHIVIGSLQQANDNAVDIFAHVTSFSQDRRISNRERHVQKAGHRLRQERLARTGRADQEQVRLFDIDIVLGLVRLLVAESLVMVVNGHRERHLCTVLSNDKIVQVSLDFGRERERLRRDFLRFLFLFRTSQVFFKNAAAHAYAITANIRTGTGDHLFDLFCRLSAKTATYSRVVLATTIH